MILYECMKKLLITIIALIFLNLSMSSHAILLLDREEKVMVPGGTSQVVLVNNFTGTVVQYRTKDGWSDSNKGYLSNLQRLFTLQKGKKGDKKGGYRYFNK